ncbi:MAG: sulfatase-like hydrolase/transferase, partial [Pseudomonadota bacterium]
VGSLFPSWTPSPLAPAGKISGSPGSGESSINGVRVFKFTVVTHGGLYILHTIYAAFTRTRAARNFSRDTLREKVVPTYMGLIKQCDDQMGRLLQFLEETDRLKDTMIIITSDHGDYLGDHWLGEKDLFHKQSAQIPLIIYDPRKEADATRGQVSDALVELIDVPATIIDAHAGTVPDHIVEGHSLCPILHGQPCQGRDYVISEYDYAKHPIARNFSVSLRDARMIMVADKEWKLVHCLGGFRPMLFNLHNDPLELHDLGDDSAYGKVRSMMMEKLYGWSLRTAQRVTMSEEELLAARQTSARRGIIIGAADASEVGVSRYVGSVPKDCADL